MRPAPVSAAGGEGAREMSTIKEFERDCAYCHQPIRLKWKKELIPPEGVRLVADQVFHDECWDKYWPNYDSKQTLPEALAG
jgi:hypothetical protein